MASGSLSSGRDFRRVYRAGHKGRADGVTVWAAPAEHGDGGRVGIAIRAAAGTAVERNRLRRRIRAILRTLATAGHDVVVGADRSAARTDFQELGLHLGRALAEATRGRSR